ncbi:hypothetical protein K9M78_05395 [Candidatus Bipolaricaulota bacterium]|nr:hypothetical protein [Candidatus Bipolaricaulota bacterium]
MNEGVTLVVATGVQGNSRPERALNQALEANTLDLLEIAGAVSGFERRILITNSERLINFSTSNSSDVSLERSSRNFNFGRSLFDIIRNYNIENLFYIGGGSGPLLEKKDFEKIVSFLVRTSGTLLANNFYSADMIGLSSAQEILKLDPPESDNGLGWLARDGGLRPHEMTRRAKTQLDLDTPVDLIPLKLSGRADGRLKEHLSQVTTGNTRIRDILPQFTDQESRLVVGGRIGASTWSYMEKNAACQVDVISEGRGSYGGNGKRGPESFWLGKSLQDLGPENFIRSVGEKGTGFFLDSRVLFDFLGEWPSRKDRFSSDLLEPNDVEPDYLRDLTRAAREYPKPVVLGGHSMISGSLYLMTDVAWKLTEPESVNIQLKTFEL